MAWALAAVALLVAAPAAPARAQGPVGSADRETEVASPASQAALALAGRTQAARELSATPGVRTVVVPASPTKARVRFFRGERALLEVDVDIGRRAVEAVWTGDQVDYPMARGYDGWFARSVNSPWVWLPLCVLFVAPFFDPRRPLRLLHLDLLVLLGFSASQLFFNRGEIGVSVPLAYPVLGYLLVRMLVAGLRPRERAGPLVPLASTRLLVIGLVLLCVFRVGLNVTDSGIREYPGFSIGSNVVDVGFAGVVGADRLVAGEQLYTDNDVHFDTYGPVNYLTYVPFELVFPYDGKWDDLPAAHAAAIAFDTLTMIGLMLLGVSIRAGPGGRQLGLALAFAWAAYPYTLYAMNTGSNDSLVAALLVFALVAASAPAARGALVGAAAMVKFAPLVLVPLMVRGTDERLEARRVLVAAAATLAVCVLSLLAVLPDGGLREFYDATVGFQLGAESPFGIWGQVDGLAALQSALKAGTCVLAAALFWWPARRTPAQLAALAAALLIATQMAGNHWIYLYIVWFAPLVLAALFAEVSERAPARRAASS